MDKKVLELAREAGFVNLADKYWDCTTAGIERFAALVAAAERQRLHDKFMQIHVEQKHSNNYWHFAARKIKEEA